MLKLIAHNYNVMFNGYSKWLNIKIIFCYREIKTFSHKKDAIKQI